MFTAVFKIPQGLEAASVTHRIDPASVEIWRDVWLAPARQPWADAIGAKRPLRSFDRRVYAQDTWYPKEPIARGTLHSVRGSRGLQVQVFPFRYNPARGLLEVARRVQVDALLRPASGPKQKGPQPLWSNSFAKVYGALVSPEEMPDQGVPAAGQDGCDYLVFVPDDRSAALEPLLDSKRQRGLRVRKIVLSALKTKDPATLQARIQSEIQTQYARSPSPTYLLLVGDADDIPPFHVTTHPSEAYAQNPDKVRKIATDFYYANVEGDGDDLTPELLAGRLPARTAEELRIMVDKILRLRILLATARELEPGTLGASGDQRRIR